jgi:hypothetical protein
LPLLAQHLQPFLAHLLSEQAALLAREESAHFVRSRIFETRAQQPGFHIGFKQIILQLRIVSGEFVIVARAHRRAGGKEDLLLCLPLSRARRQRERRKGEREHQSAQHRCYSSFRG